MSRSSAELTLPSGSRFTACFHSCGSMWTPCNVNAEQLVTPLKRPGISHFSPGPASISTVRPLSPAFPSPPSLSHTSYAQIPVGFSFSTTNRVFDAQPPFAVQSCGVPPTPLASPPAKVFWQTKVGSPLRGAVGRRLVCGVSSPLREPWQRGVEAGQLWHSQAALTVPASSQVEDTL